MKRKTLFGLIGLLAPVAFAPVVQTQTQNKEQEKKGRIEFRVVRREPPKPPEPQLGDRFERDPVTGDWIIEYRRPDRTVRSAKVRQATKVKPEITSSFEQIASTLVRYRYTLRNGGGAAQAIQTFCVGMSDPAQVRNATKPMTWWIVGASGGGPSRFTWAANEGQALAPSGDAIEFSFDVPSLPGLTQTYIKGLLSDASMEISLDGEPLSDWLRARVHDAIKFENNTVQPYTIGPRIALEQLTSGGLIKAIFAELSGATHVPAFVSNNPSLPNIIESFASADKAKALSYRSTFSQMGTTPFEKAFFTTMAFNLDYLARIL